MMNTLNTENPIEKPFRKTGDPVDLTSESPLHPRRKSRRIMVGPVPVGGGAPISVQSMTNTLTANVPATLQQIAELTAAGCDIVRVAVPSQDDAEHCRKSAANRRFRSSPISTSSPNTCSRPSTPAARPCA